MAEARTREDIARDYRAARAVGDHATTVRLQSEEACHVMPAPMQRLAVDDASTSANVDLKDVGQPLLLAS